STDGGQGDTSTAQILNITRELLNQRNNDTKVTEALFQVLASNMTQVLQQLMYTQGNSELLNMHTGILQGLNKNISQVSQQLGSTEAKVDSMRSVVDEHLVHTLNVSDVLNQVQQTTEQSAQRLINIVNTLSNLQDTSTSTAGVATDILVIVEDLLQLQNVSSLFNSITPVSCKDVKAVLPNSPSGWYNLNNQNTYCNMEELCGSGGGWTRLAYLDMTDATQNCPSGFRLYQSGGVRACGRTNSSGGSCVSVQFPSNGISYSQICGRVTGYQYHSPD
uniref:Fibrinogen C-terminal domain-containing protein n=1 Tax=Amphimedon queenslandica TaxID=400682 RepID=A0A1X7UD56_AMPQE